MMLESTPIIEPSVQKLIEPYLLSHEISSRAMWGGAGMEMVQGEIARLFLLSNKKYQHLQGINPILYKPVKATKPKSKPSKKRDQYKYCSFSGKITTKDKVTYRVNSKKSGVLLEIMHRTIKQLDVCIANWSRVLVVRFDLHQKFYTKDSKYISRFIGALRKQFKRKYDLHQFGFVWVREQERSKYQHYHFAIFLDGSKVNHSSRVLTIVRSIWTNIDDKNHVPTIKNPYYFIDNQEVKADVIYRISYLAKGRGKGYAGKHSNDFTTSRLVA